MEYAKSADPDQTVGAVWSEATMFAIPLNSLWNNCIKSRILAKKYEIKCSKF